VEHTKYSTPLDLTKVVGNVTHEFGGGQTPAVGAERFTGFDEISRGVHLVYTLNLAKGDISVGY